MTTKWHWRGTVRLACAGLALAAIAPLTGCDATDAAFALVRSTATEAVRDSATEVIGGAVDGLIGDVLPDLGS